MITASQIVDLLARRHSQDVFVTECKTGPTQSARRGELFRLDAWAMKKSWSNPRFFGYEIKVSREDFQRDEKWTAYLDHCTDFSFVCPSGLIQPDELPEGVGLLWVAKTGSRLYTKRKPTMRLIQPGIGLLLYVLMSRVKIVPANFYDAEEPREVWARWLAEKTGDRILGYNVSQAIRQEIEHRVDAVRYENRDLLGRMGEYDNIILMLNKMGLDPAKVVTWDSRNRVKEIMGREKGELETSLDGTIAALQKLRKGLADGSK